MRDARFDRIGPFDFRRSDQVIAAIYIGLVIGRGWGKAFSYLVLLISFLVIIGSVATGDWLGVAAGAALLVYVFIIAPALRSNARNRAIVVSDSDEGLQVETEQVRSVYRWDRIKPSRRFAGRLFVMIDKNCGLVIPERATTAENFARLVLAVNANGEAD